MQQKVQSRSQELLIFQSMEEKSKLEEENAAIVSLIQQNCVEY